MVIRHTKKVNVGYRMYFYVIRSNSRIGDDCRDFVIVLCVLMITRLLWLVGRLSARKPV